MAPDVAERRRSQAERERARVTVFREESGAVGLSGRDLPAAQALSGHASVAGPRGGVRGIRRVPGQTSSSLQALAYLHLLNGVNAQDAIAFARAASAEPPDGTGPDGDKEDVEAGSRTDPAGDSGSDGEDEGPDGGGEDPGGASGPGDGDGGPRGGGVQPALPEVTVPLVTLQGHAARAGDNRLLGPLDPAMARDLAAAAARSPFSRWEVTVVDDQGYAVGHGIARPGRGKRHQSQPPGMTDYALPALINITVSEARLRQLKAQSAEPRSGAPPGDWEFVPRTAGAWTLTLPGGRALAVRFDVVPTHSCDHTYEVSTYQPSERLRRLIQVRDRECTFPPCSRPAHESDFEHAIPYDKGGRTDACNAGARSRRCHQVKQTRDWTVTQPKPGWHSWTTPTGRTYIQEPWRYTA